MQYFERGVARLPLPKRLGIAVYDAASAFAVACILACAWTPQAFAYIDPSVMTYTIQAVAGVAVALSTVLGVALRRGRKTLLRILDIDEFAKREVEPDLHRVAAEGTIIPNADEIAAQARAEVADSAEAGASSTVQLANEGVPSRTVVVGSPDAVAATIGAVASTNTEAEGTSAATSTSVDAKTAEPAKPAKRKRGPKLPAYKPGWKERLVFGVIAAFFFVFTIYFVAPLEIVSGSSSDLVFSMGDVWWVLVGPGLGIIAGITLVLTLLRGRSFSVALLLVFAVGLCAYLQALFLNFGLPAADGNTIYWDDYPLQNVVSSLVWFVVVAVAVVSAVLFSRRAQGVVAILSVFLVIVQGVGLASLAIGAAVEASEGTSDTSGKVLMTEDQLFTVNPKHNVIVFVLDTFDTAYLTRILNDFNPNVLDGLTGFTNYENATSAMIPTRFAIPEMMTGQMPSFDEPFSVYKQQRYARSSFLPDIYNANYSIGLYTDSMRISSLPKSEQHAITSKTVNMHDMPDSAMDFGGTLYSLYQMGQYRDVLWPLKWLFWYYTDEINQSMVQSSEDASPDETIYLIDDVRYYHRLCNFGLSLEDGDYAGAYRFIHLLGSHYPFNYDEEVNDLGEYKSDVFKQSQGAIKIVNTYIEELKRLGVYENSTIIVTADHGYWTIVLELHQYDN